jgi:hypothetical protein
VTEDQVPAAELTAAAEANERIRHWARKVAADERSVWEFACECGQPLCSQRVNMTLARYDSARHTNAAVLAHGHISARAQAARSWSVELRAEAQAVRSQAEHQIRRMERLRLAPLPRRDYQLVVEGELSDRLERAFAGMSLTRGEGRTMIFGRVRDQAHLHELLRRVTDLGLTLLSVASISDRQEGFCGDSQRSGL